MGDDVLVTNLWDEPGEARRGIRATLIAGCILAAHALIGWLFLMSGGVILSGVRSGHDGALLLLPAARPVQRTEPLSAVPLLEPSSRIPLSDFRPLFPLVGGIPPKAGDGVGDEHPGPPSVDWAEQRALAGRSAASADPTQRFKDFGFPHKGEASDPDSPAFDWDYARTHRVESLPEGGIVIHLNDNCFVVFMPFPFPLCLLGKQKANGDLFKHMRDPRRLGDWKPAP